MKPGIYKMTDDQYRYEKALSEGAITDAFRSLCYYRDRRVTKLIKRKPQTPAMIAGAAAHCALLEPERFEEEYVAYDEARLPKKTRDQFEEAGLIPLKRDAYDLYKHQATYIREHPELGNHFHVGFPEHCILWEQSGRMCKTKPDWIPDEGLSIVSVKTIGDGKGIDLDDERAVRNEAARSNWRIGTGWQSLGAQAVFGAIPAFYYLIIRLAYPHEDNIRLIPVPRDEQEENMRLCLRVFHALDKALTTDEWPAKSGQPFDLVTPEWQRRLDEQWET